MKRLLAILLVTVIASTSVGAPPIAGLAAVSADDAKQLAKADDFYRSGKYTEAVAALTPLKDKYPAVGDIHRLLGHCYYELDKLPLARTELIEAIAHGRLTADVLGRLVQIDRRLDRPTTETAALLFTLDPTSRSSQLLYADVLANSGPAGFDDAQRLYDAILKAEPANANAWIGQANLHLRRSRPTDAAAAFETAFTLGDTTPRLPQLIADIWREQNDLAAALLWYDRAASLRTEPDATLNLRRADLALTLKQHDRAAALLTDLAASPDRTIAGKARLLLGKLAVAQGDEAEAVKQWEQAIALGADDRKLLAYAGTVRYNKGDYVKAADYLARAASGAGGGGDPDGRVLHALVLSLIKQGEKEQAAAVTRRYIEHFGVDATAKDLIAQLK